MIKKAWKRLKEEWPGLTIWQKSTWVLFLWVLFPILMLAERGAVEHVKRVKHIDSW